MSNHQIYRTSYFTTFIFSSVYVRRNYWNRKVFRFMIFNRVFTRFGISLTRFGYCWKSMRLFGSNTHFVATVSQKLTHGISPNFISCYTLTIVFSQYRREPNRWLGSGWYRPRSDTGVLCVSSDTHSCIYLYHSITVTEIHQTSYSVIRWYI